MIVLHAVKMSNCIKGHKLFSVAAEWIPVHR